VDCDAVNYFNSYQQVSYALVCKEETWPGVTSSFGEDDQANDVAENDDKTLKNPENEPQYFLKYRAHCYFVVVIEAV